MANRPRWGVANQLRQLGQRRIAAMGKENEWRQELRISIQEPKDILGTRANFLQFLKSQEER